MNGHSRAQEESQSQAWSHFYNGRLGWSAHATNIVHHLPYLSVVLRGRPKSILEVGSGSGSMSTFLSYVCKQVVSVDIERGIVDQCRRDMPRLMGSARYVLGDAFRLSEMGLPRFSVAVSQGLMEHFDDDDIGRLIGEQLKVCGRVTFSVPNRAYARQDFGNERLLTTPEWRRLVRRLGFNVRLVADYRPFHWSKGLWRTMYRLDPIMTMCVIDPL